MKNFYLLLILIIFFSSAKAQTNLFPTSGKTGIGTTNPANGLLEIIGTGDLLWMTSAQSTVPIQLNAYNNPDFRIIQRSSGLMTFWTNTIERMRLDQNGDLAIGTTNSKGYKLAVGGSIIAESVKVKLQGTWPDYIFSKNYNPTPLQSIEQHIRTKGHLPGMPSAAEVKANGIDLGEMNAKLLQKIEELTLYLIEQDKEIKLLKKSTSVP